MSELERVLEVKDRWRRRRFTGDQWGALCIGCSWAEFYSGRE